MQLPPPILELIPGVVIVIVGGVLLLLTYSNDFAFGSVIHVARGKAPPPILGLSIILIGLVATALPAWFLLGPAASNSSRVSPVGGISTTAVLATATNQTSRQCLDIQPGPDDKWSCSGTFPKSIIGPAIVEWAGDPSGGCGIYVVTSGQNFTWHGVGMWWEYANIQTLNAEYPQHRAAYYVRDDSTNTKHGCIEGPPPSS